MEAAVRNSINKQTGTLYESDVQNISSLNANNANITDLTGIENLKSLDTLYLNSNSISNLTPLRSLINFAKLISWKQ